MIIEEFLIRIIPYITGFLEGIGVFIIVLGSIESLYKLVKSRFDFGDEDLKIEFAKALALSLEFKLAAEILKTVVVRTIDEFIILSAIVVLRVVITIVLHWEIKTSEEMEQLHMEDEDYKIKQKAL